MEQQAQAKNPFHTNHFARTIRGQHVEFVLTSYDNYLFFTVTELGKLGTMIKAECDVDLDGDQSYSVTTLIGKRDILYELLARKIIELTSASSRKPLLLALAFQTLDPEKLKDIEKEIKENIVVTPKIPVF